MDFTWSAEQDAYRMDVRRWLEDNRPQSLARGEDPDAGGDDATWQRLKEWHKKLYHAGWAGLTWPEGIRRARRHLYRAGHLSARTRTSQPADGMQRARRHHDRSRADAMGHRRAEKALPESDPRRRRDLVRGNVGAGRGLGPRVDSDAAPSSRATSLSSTARRCGPRSRIARTSCSCSCAPIPTCPSTKG